ncbi:hypothetical protein [Kordia aestuariivivens]|uniref:hypothetical protein n=1 Tax=Kordia aestuariivivens TaxID=2759037 RepID=UPI001C07A36B|nr:hypothetical protein [Kordia aestuariivivens]
MNFEYEHKLVNIENNVQDTSTEAWGKICEYVEIAAKEEHTEFNPAAHLGIELYSKLFTLPSTIAKLKKVKKLFLYGSNLKRIPPEIGEMTSLEEFVPYTSYNLHWFPYEITNCENLTKSTVSTRALYGNFKHRKPFPDLRENTVTYDSEIINCSVCKTPIKQQETNQWWISLDAATDILPLLVNICSLDCKKALPTPPKAFLKYPHKGGKNLGQPSYQDWEDTYMKKISMKDIQQNSSQNNKLSIWKAIRKFWRK